MRVRYPQRRDLPGVIALLRRVGLEADELELGRLLRVDPRTNAVVVAVHLVGRTEEVVGFGSMDRFADDPDLVIADEGNAPGAGERVERALIAHAQRARRIA